jgi:hypothetical protein
VSSGALSSMSRLPCGVSSKGALLRSKLFTGTFKPRSYGKRSAPETDATGQANCHNGPLITDSALPTDILLENTVGRFINSSSHISILVSRRDATHLKIAFSLCENKDVFAVLLGSGISRTAQIPTGWEITLDIVRRDALAQGGEEQPDWAAWYRDTTGDEASYSALLEDVASSPEERRSMRHRYIEPNEQDRKEGRKVLTAAHHAIPRLVRDGYIRVIITTNAARWSCGWGATHVRIRRKRTFRM